MNKTEIRKLIKKDVSEICEENLYNKSRIIEGFVIMDEVFINAKSVFIYLAVKGEVDTMQIIKAAMQADKLVYIPKICGDRMMMTLLNDKTELKPNNFGIMEDEKTEAVMVKTDLIIAPLVAYDKEFNRLGKGKGYYDKFLAENPAPVMALAFAEQYYENIPSEPHDKKMDYIAIEKGIIRR